MPIGAKGQKYSFENNLIFFKLCDLQNRNFILIIKRTFCCEMKQPLRNKISNRASLGSGSKALILSELQAYATDKLETWLGALQ